MLFDTHVHLNVDRFKEDYQDVIERAQDAGVSYMTVVGFNTETIEKAIQLADSVEFIYAAVGWHPVDAVHMTDGDLKQIEQLAAHRKVVALGEMGLDYHWDESPKDVQHDVFRKQIRLAKKVGLPIIIHNRDAHDDVVNILQEENAAEVGGIMHCFSGSIEMARQCIDMNFYISFAGPVTFKNAKSIKEVVQAVPLERLLIETDCPYLAPHPYRGKRNEPAYVKLVAEKIAELKNLSYEDVAKQTTENAKKVFNIR